MTTFIQYQQPMRTRRTARDMLATFTICAIAFVVAVRDLLASSEAPGFFGIAALLIGIVTAVLGSVLLWKFVTGAVNHVWVSDQGVSFDGQDWPWESAAYVRTYPRGASGVYRIHITVYRQGRSRLTLPIEVRDHDAETVVAELKDYLSRQGYDIKWRTDTN